MKITKLSLAAIAAMTLTTGAMADVDFKIGGQLAAYYETHDAGDMNLFSQGHGNTATSTAGFGVNPATVVTTNNYSGTAGNSVANVGIQLNATADLGNGFGLGLQGTALNTMGIENNVVSNTKQNGLGNNGDTASANGYFSFTKAYLTKKVANTTLKMGRQELPKSLSPLAFSEGWNVFKNTFDAIVAINTDIPDTTVVGAYVSRSNTHGNLNTFGDMAGGAMDEGAYMLTVANKSNKMFQPTISYYALQDITPSRLGSTITTTDSGSAIWANVNVDAGLPVKLALQGGTIDPKNTLKKTNAYGAKISGKASGVDLSLAYSDVNNGALGVQNVGTGVKSPLFTQMIYNQGAIASDASTFVLKASMPLAGGKITAQYGMTNDSNTGGTSATDNDYNELDLMYKTKLSGMDVFAAYIMRDADLKSFGQTKSTTVSAPGAAAPAAAASDTKDNIVRVWARYNF